MHNLSWSPYCPKIWAEKWEFLVFLVLSPWQHTSPRHQGAKGWGSSYTVCGITAVDSWEEQIFSFRLAGAAAWHLRRLNVDMLYCAVISCQILSAWEEDSVISPELRCKSHIWDESYVHSIRMSPTVVLSLYNKAAVPLSQVQMHHCRRVGKCSIMQKSFLPAVAQPLVGAAWTGAKFYFTDV